MDQSSSSSSSFSKIIHSKYAGETSISGVPEQWICIYILILDGGDSPSWPKGTSEAWIWPAVAVSMSDWRPVDGTKVGEGVQGVGGFQGSLSLLCWIGF